MQTPVDDSGIFTEVSRSAQASPKSSLEPLARNPSQGPSSRSGNSVDSHRPSPRASGSPTCLPASLSRMLPAVFTIKLPAEPPRSLFPWYTVAATPQTRLVWSRKTTSPTEYNNGARKHQVARGMQTSQAPKPKPRASA